MDFCDIVQTWIIIIFIVQLKISFAFDIISAIFVTSPKHELL